MSSLLQLEVLEPAELQAKYAAEQVANEAKERARLAASNRSAGTAQPQPGDRLYVTTMRGIPQRFRAGVLFKADTRTAVVVVDDADPTGYSEATKLHAVHAHAAEMILADSSLTVSTQGATEADASELRKALASKDAEIAALKADHARALREARQGAKDDPNGGPSRLRAARGVRAPEADFGGKD